MRRCSRKTQATWCEQTTNICFFSLTKPKAHMNLIHCFASATCSLVGAKARHQHFQSPGQYCPHHREIGQISGKFRVWHLCGKRKFLQCSSEARAHLPVRLRLCDVRVLQWKQLADMYLSVQRWANFLHTMTVCTPYIVHGVHISVHLSMHFGMCAYMQTDLTRRCIVLRSCYSRRRQRVICLSDMLRSTANDTSYTKSIDIRLHSRHVYPAAIFFNSECFFLIGRFFTPRAI